MPIYEYRCRECDCEFDELRTIVDADKQIACVSCFSNQTYRIISNFFAHNNQNTIGRTSNSCGGCSSHACASCGG